MPGMEIHDRPQIKEAFLQRDVRDVGRPSLIHRGDVREVHHPAAATAGILQIESVETGHDPQRRPRQAK